jgi:hypothetical protein
MFKGHGQKLTRKMDTAILALIEEKTYAAAAKRTGIALSTLARWLLVPEFVEAYRVAREKLATDALARLQALAGPAIATLEKNLKCGRPADENRAAAIILELGQRVKDDQELAQKLETLKANLNASPSITLNLEASNRGLHEAPGAADGPALTAPGRPRGRPREALGWDETRPMADSTPPPASAEDIVALFPAERQVHDGGSPGSPDRAT